MKAARKALQTPPPAEEPFWRRKTLAEMSRVEWESLCDGCGKCCLLKLEYEDTGEIDWSNIACRQLDPQTCRCRNYALRKTLVEDCVSLTPEMVGNLAWLPATCAYRLVDEGSDQTVHQAGISVRGRVIGEDEAGDVEDHLVDWLD